MLKRYSEYKDSGIEWVGQVPEPWVSKRLKHLVRLVNEKGVSEEDSLPINLENIESWTGRFISGEAVDQEPSQEEMKRFKSGDVLFNKLRPYLAKVYRTSANGVCGGELLVLRPQPESMRAGFLFYRLVSKDFIGVVDGATYGTKMPRASWEFIGNLRIPYPSTQEQETISSYLEDKTEQINALITKKERMIELLKEERVAIINQAVTKGLDSNVEVKNSGIEWLGKVPKHWKIGKVRFSLFVTSGNGFPDELQGKNEGEYPFYKVSDINLPGTNVSEANNYVSRDDILVRRWNVIAKGSILLAKIGAALAKNHRKLSLVDCLIDNNMMAVTPRDVNGHLKYYYYLMSVIKMEWFSNPGAVPSVDMSRFLSFSIPDIKHGEQKTIADYLDQKIAQIDNHIAIGQKSIESLKEYRTSLISEVVNGKIDVRGCAA